MAESNNNEVIGFIASTVETMRNDIASMRDAMVTKDSFDAAVTAVRGDIEQVQLRFDSMEHSIVSRFEHVEGEISRLRSAVYVLGKDRPDVLRLLGHQTS
ncbi:MAG: hypothetical protein ACT4OT_04235 [Acidobacteriota bacterium]